MTILDAAHQRALHWLKENPPVAMPLFPTADDFEAAKKWILELAYQTDQLIYAQASEANANAPNTISTKSFMTLTQDAVHDNGDLVGFEDAKESLLEAQMEAAE